MVVRFRKVAVMALVLMLVLSWPGMARAKGGPPAGKGLLKNKVDTISLEDQVNVQDTETGEQEGLGQNAEARETEETANEQNSPNNGKGYLKRLQEKLQKRNEQRRAKYEKFQSRMTVRGRGLDFDVPPVIFAGRTLIPVRAVTRGLGATVDWDAETQTVTITRDGIKIILNLGSSQVTVNGETVTLDVPAELINNRTFVPIRFISETLGETVEWDPETGDINIGDEEASEETEGQNDEEQAGEEEQAQEESSTDTGSND